MPSSPSAAAHAWEPAELTDSPARTGTDPGVRPVLRVAPAPRAEAQFEPFTVAGSTPVAAAPFEVAGAAAVPPAVLEPARRAAVAAGYAAGWAVGVADARSAAQQAAAATTQRAEHAAVAARAALERALAAVAGAAEQLHARDADRTLEVEQLLVAAAFDIAEAVVGATVRHDPQRGAAAVARALALAPECDAVTVALHPADRATLLSSGACVPAHVRLVDGAALAPGDAIATAGATTVDARIAAGLDRVRQVLAG